MPRFALVLALALLAAGCLGGAAPQEATTSVKSSAEEAGAVSGPAPAAPKEAYTATLAPADESGAERTVSVYPVAMPSNGAKAPVTKEIKEEFEVTDCGPTSQLPLGAAGLSENFKVFNVSDAFAPGDVFSYDIKLTWTNTDQSWGEIHAFYNLGSASNFHTEPTGEKRGEIVLNFTGQGHFAEGGRAGLGAACWYGGTATPIPFVLTATFTFAEGALPSETPVLLDVPDNATTLVVRGVAIDPTQGVLSHFRVFDPKDEVVCECALSSDEPATSLTLPGPGKYVILVDHTANGFVSVGLDAPSPSDLLPLPIQGFNYPVMKGVNERNLDKTIELTLPSTPLNMWAWVFPDGTETGASPSAGAGQAYEIHVSNARGEVLRQRMAGYVTARVLVPGAIGTNEWQPLPTPGEWEFAVDHHAYAPGQHFVHVKAETLKGDVLVFARHYVRP